MDPFWVVWNPDGNAPMFQHSTEHLARMEAERLGRTNPGQSFYVLAAVGVAKKIEVQYTPIKTDPGMPF